MIRPVDSDQLPANVADLGEVGSIALRLLILPNLLVDLCRVRANVRQAFAKPPARSVG